MGSDDCAPGALTLPDAATLIKAKALLATNRMMATYLTILEEIVDEHDEAMGKLMDALPPEHKANVVLADHLGDARLEAIRRRVLKVGNDARRELDETVDNLRI